MNSLFLKGRIDILKKCEKRECIFFFSKGISKGVDLLKKRGGGKKIYSQNNNNNNNNLLQKIVLTY